MKSRICLFSAIILIVSMPALCFGAQLSDYVKVSGGIVEQTVAETVETLEDRYEKAGSVREKLDILSLLAPIQEQLGLYQEAQTNYSLAANYSASINSAAGKGAVADSTYLLGAVRCALSCGDTPSADYIMSTAFTGTVSTETQAYRMLYAVWSWLCKSENGVAPQQPIAVLRQSIQLSSMKAVRPAMLLTLWYITGDEACRDQLEKEFPDSIECAVTKGNASLMPAPFWYFVPRTPAS